MSQKIMATQEFSVTKKVGRPRGRKRPETATVRVPVETLHQVDAWIAAQPEPRPSRPEAIRLALKDWLTGLGLLKHRDDPEGAN